MVESDVFENIDRQVATPACTSGGVHAWLKAFIFSLAFVLLVIFFTGGLTFESNDDVAMLFLTAGVGTTDIHESHLLYTHEFLGRILCDLYASKPDIPWYSLYLCISLLVSFTVITRLALFRVFDISTSQDILQKCLSWICLIAVMIVVFLRPLALLQFTTTSGMLAIAGSLLLLQFYSWKSKYCLISLFSGLSLIIFSSMVRLSGAQFIIILLAMTLLLNICLAFDFKKLFRAVCLGGLLGLICLAVDMSNKQAYSDENWKEFYRFNRARIYIEMHNINLARPEAQRALRSVLWSDNDYFMGKSWYVRDPRLYSLERLESFREAMTDSISPQKLSVIVNGHLSNIFDLSILSMVMLSLVLLASSRQSGPRYLSLILLGLALFMSFSVLIWIYRVPPRVYAVGVSFFIVYALSRLRSTAAIGAYDESSAAAPESISRAAGDLIVMLVCSLISIYAVYMHIERRNQVRASFDAAMQQIQLKPDTRLLSWGGAFPVETLRPFENPARFLRGINFLSVGTNLNTPIFKSRAKKWGIDDLIMELDKVDYFCVTESQLDTIRNFVREHSGRELDLLPVYDSSDSWSKFFKVKYKTVEQSYSGAYISAFPPFIEADAGSTSFPLYVGGREPAKPGRVLPTIKDMRIHRLGSSSTVYELLGSHSLLEFTGFDGFRVGDYPFLELELALDPGISTRSLFVYMGTAGGKKFVSTGLIIAPDGILRKYVVDLEKSKLSKNDIIEYIQFMPAHPNSNQGGFLEIKSITLRN